MINFHEDPDKLTEKDLDLHRILRSIIEEIEAVDWYAQRAAATKNKVVKKIVLHNMEEEIEHACLGLEWLRRNYKGWSDNLDRFLYRKGDLLKEASLTLEKLSADNELKSPKTPKAPKPLKPPKAPKQSLPKLKKVDTDVYSNLNNASSKKTQYGKLNTQKNTSGSSNINIGYNNTKLAAKTILKKKIIKNIDIDTALKKAYQANLYYNNLKPEGRLEEHEQE